MRILLSEPAKNDLVSIHGYVTESSGLRRADDVVDRIAATFELLSDNPLMGRRREEFDRRGVEVRSFPEPPFVVFYAVVYEGLLIARVLHEARDVKAEWILGRESEQ